MLNKWDITKEVGKLDRLINELSIDLVAEKQRSAPGSSRDELVKEMEEALCELRQARGLKHLLGALEQQQASTWGKKIELGVSH